ncbi:hypothetical protein KC315_g6222 [Hortaea werneckii]|nr:hypothetical protein KC315_g6222 [Hortaea werneckii]
MPPEQQKKRQVENGGELPGPSSQRSKPITPHTEQSVEAEGSCGCSTAAGETPPVPGKKGSGDSTAVERSGDKMAQEMTESRDSESAAGMGVSTEKTGDHQTRRNRRSRPKLGREDLLKGRYSSLGVPLVELRQQMIQRCKQILCQESPVFQGSESEDSESESE